MNQSQRLVLFKTAGHGKSQIDNLHGFPAQIMRENEALDSILTIEELISKCQAAESTTAHSRKEHMTREFVYIDKLKQVFVQKARKTAFSLKIR